MSTKTTSEYTKDVLDAIGKIKELHNSFPNAKEYFEVIVEKIQKLEERVKPLTRKPIHEDFEYLAKPFLELSLEELNTAVEAVVLKIHKENKSRLELKKKSFYAELEQEGTILKTFNHTFNIDGLQ